MKNEIAVNRRSFFRRSVAHVLDTFRSCCDEESLSKKAYCAKDEASILLGDLSAELIVMEAKRLGVDSCKKEDVAEILVQEMIDSRR